MCPTTETFDVKTFEQHNGIPQSALERVVTECSKGCQWGAVIVRPTAYDLRQWMIEWICIEERRENAP